MKRAATPTDKSSVKMCTIGSLRSTVITGSVESYTKMVKYLNKYQKINPEREKTIISVDDLTAIFSYK